MTETSSEIIEKHLKKMFEELDILTPGCLLEVSDFKYEEEPIYRRFDFDKNIWPKKLKLEIYTYVTKVEHRI